MSTRDVGNTLSSAKTISLNRRQRTFSNTLGGADQADVVAMRIRGRSSLEAQLTYEGDRPTLELFQDRNGDGQLRRREQVARAGSLDASTELLKAPKVEGGTYYLRMTPGLEGELEYQLTLKADAAGSRSRNSDVGSVRISPRNWSARFINLNRRTLRDYENYDFSQPAAVMDLGAQKTSRRAIADLNLDYGSRSPDGVQRNRFAMEAWTRVRLRSGQFYRFNSNSDDGLRVILKDRRGTVISEFNDNWMDRKTGDPAWQQVITPVRSGAYDLYVQYYDNRGSAVVDLELEKLRPTGQVLASTLNVRATPSTLNNTPIDVLARGETFQVVRQIQSSNDTVYQNWYQVITREGTSGYVSAGSEFVGLVGESSNVAIVGSGGFEPPIPDDSNPGNPGLPGNGTRGVISSSVWITSDDKISIRADKSISGLELGRVGSGTPLTLIEKVTGGTYLNSYDAWYRVRLSLNGREQEGYVAAYYVDVLDNPGIYETGISKDNGAYKAHLNEVLTPTYYGLSYKPYIEQAAARYSWLQPSVVAGIGSRESAWGRLLSPRGPSGTGDGGHGRGLMQIDDRYHQPFIVSGRWSTPKDNIDYAIDEVLARYYNSLDQNTNLQGLDLLRGAIAAYNSGLGNVTRALSQGLDVDYYTTGQDYSWDVLNRAGFFQLNGWA